MLSVKKVTAVIFVILTLYAGVLTVMALSLWLECQASDTLLHMLALARPGVPISKISDRLGSQIAMFSDSEDILRCGSMEDASFCRGKKLFLFLGVTPPCRTLQVYTDANDVIVYATWHSE